MSCSFGAEDWTGVDFKYLELAYMERITCYYLISSSTAWFNHGVALLLLFPPSSSKFLKFLSLYSLIGMGRIGFWLRTIESDLDPSMMHAIGVLSLF